MKKLIFAALLIASTGVLASFKSDTTVVKHDTVSDRKELGTADAKTTKHTATNDRKELGTAD